MEKANISNIYLVGNLGGERRENGRMVIFFKKVTADHFPELERHLSSKIETFHTVVGVIFKTM